MKKEINDLYDIKFIYYNGTSFKEKKIINVLEEYYNIEKEHLTVIFFDETEQEVVIRYFNNGNLISKNKRGDTLKFICKNNCYRLEV